jgi:Na+-driven multidrug efflux pump
MTTKTLVLAVALLFLAPGAAYGYVGPGTGLAIIGAALAFIASLFLGVLGFVWYPFKRLYRALFGGSELPPEPPPE